MLWPRKSFRKRNPTYGKTLRYFIRHITRQIRKNRPKRGQQHVRQQRPGQKPADTVRPLCGNCRKTDELRRLGALERAHGGLSCGLRILLRTFYAGRAAGRGGHAGVSSSSEKTDPGQPGLRGARSDGATGWLSLLERGRRRKKLQGVRGTPPHLPPVRLFDRALKERRARIRLL